MVLKWSRIQLPSAGSLDLPSQGVVITVSPAAAVFLAIAVVAMVLVKRHGRHKRNTTRTDTALASHATGVFPFAPQDMACRHYLLFPFSTACTTLVVMCPIPCQELGQGSGM